MLNPKQIALLLARLSEAGYKTDRQKFDWLFEQGVNVNTFDQLADLSNARLNVLLEQL